jgi:hypothetical protein
MITTYAGGNSINYFPYVPGYGCSNGASSSSSNAYAGVPGMYPVVYSSGSYTSYSQFSQNISVKSSNMGGGAHNHPIMMDIQYCDVILAQKT